jgi:UDP-glucose 4-epimerase
MEKKVGGETFQVATGMERTVGEVAEMIAAAFARRGIKMEITHDAPRVGDVKRNFADTGKAGSMLGWTPSMNLDLGIETTIDYFIKTAERD